MKKLFFILIHLLSFYSIKACDACASFSGGLQMGITPLLKNNTILSRYQITRFNTIPFTGSKVINKDLTHSFDLQSRISLNERWQVNLIVPYNIYNQSGEYGNSKLSGPGDISFISSFVALNKNNKLFSGAQHMLLINGGIKLPTGKSDATDKTGLPFNPRMQPGSGSFDFLGQINYILKIRKNSIVTELSGRKNTMNDNSYQIGNHYKTAVRYARWIDFTNGKLLFNTGYTFDYFADDYSKSEKFHGMKGRSEHSVLLGLDAFYKNTLISLHFQKPFYKIEAQNSINNLYSINLSVGFGF